MDYPSSWEIKVDDNENTGTADGDPQSGINIYIKSNKDDWIFIYGQNGHIGIPPHGQTEHFITTENISGTIMYSQSDGRIRIDLILDKEFNGAIVDVNEKVFNENKQQILGILKSIKIVMSENFISNMTPKTQPTLPYNNKNITESEKEDIQKYIEMIYDGYYGETLPEFDDVNNANEDWAWMMALDYLEDIKYPDEYKLFTSNEVEEAARILYGDSFKKEITKDSSRHVKYFENENLYRGAAMSTDILWRFIEKDITKQDNLYTIVIIEYTQSWESDSSTHREIISNSEYEEITSFNRKYPSASTDDEMKLLETESATIEAKIKDFVLKNANEFNSKELVIEKNKETGLLHILSSDYH